MFRTLKGPLNLQVEVTESCDNACRHCYNFFRHADYRYLTMTKQQIEKVVSELRSLEVIRGVVTGGEPLTAVDNALYLASGMRDCGMGVTLNTDLTLFDEEIGLQLKDIGIEAIMKSLIADEPHIHDFVTQRQGSWVKTVNGIKLSIKMGFRVLVNQVLTKWNIDRVQQTGDFVGSLGADKFGATRACAPTPIAKDFENNLISIDELRKSLEILYELKEKWGYNVDVFEHYPWCAMQDIEKYEYLSRRKCTAGVTSATIGTNGELRPCGHSSMTYGNVFEEGLQKAWLKMSDWRQQKYSRQCKHCKYYRSCTGGCPVEDMNASDEKDHHRTTPRDVILTPKKKVLTPVNINAEFKFRHDVVFREENFGGIVASGTAGVVFVDKEAFNVLTSIDKHRFFTVQEIVSTFRVESNSSVKIFTKLANQKLILERG